MDKIQMSLMTQSDFIGKSNIEIERAVLNILMNDDAAFFRVSNQLSIREFSDVRHKYIYMALQEVSEVSKIDSITIADKLLQRGYNDIVAKIKTGYNLLLYLTQVNADRANISSLDDYVKILNGYAKRRELNMLSDEVTKKCNDSEDTQDIINFINTKIVDIQEMGEVEEFDITEANKGVLKSLDPRTEGDKSIQTYIDAIDSFIYCIEPGELVILAAAPSMGKTSLALEIFKNQILNDQPTGFFSLEMGTVQLLNRMYAVESDIKLSKIRTRMLSLEERKRINATMGGFENKKFWIDDRARKLSYICNKIRKLVIRHGVKLVVIDYLQLITCDMGKAGNREQEVSIISRTLKELAAELKIPIIALSQINRAIHQRANKRPQLGDLRESGSLEQDADMVMFLHRPAYFDIANGIPTTEYAEVIFAKGRSTGIGMVEVAFQSGMTKFLSKTPDEMKVLKNDQLGDLEPNENFDNEKTISPQQGSFPNI